MKNRKPTQYSTTSEILFVCVSNTDLLALTFYLYAVLQYWHCGNVFMFVCFAVDHCKACNDKSTESTTVGLCSTNLIQIWPFKTKNRNKINECFISFILLHKSFSKHSNFLFICYFYNDGIRKWNLFEIFFKMFLLVMFNVSSKESVFLFIYCLVW